MVINCPICEESLELPEGLSDNQHLRRPLCGTKFVVRNDVAVPLLAKAAIVEDRRPHFHLKQCAEVGSGRPERPKLVLASIVGFYVLTALGFMGTASWSFISALATACFIGGLTLGMQRGRNWARIVMTILVGGIWVMCCAIDVAYAALRTGDGLYRAKITFKRYRDSNVTGKVYAYHVTKIEVLTGNLVHAAKDTDPKANTSITNQEEASLHLTAAILLNGVCNVNGAPLIEGSLT